ncbi:MAG: hypothetical protein H0W61_12525 [Bacteroidetes bacterium]|nr:hypothetical protein [Bacteroidota bacterium]
MLPKDRVVFEEINAKSMDVVRYENQNGNLTSPVMVRSLLRSYYEGDTAAWMKLFRSDKNKAGFIYSALYAKKNSEKTTPSEKEKFNKMSYHLMMLACSLDPEIAQACGLWFADTLINNNKIYTYVFSMHTTSTSATTHSVLAVNVDASVLRENSIINTVKGKKKGNTANIFWDAFDYKNEYSGYNIYRSEDSLSYKKLNTAPLILLSNQFEKNKREVFYQDTLRDRGKKVYYVVKGINYFGAEGRISNVLVMQPFAGINSAPLIDTIKVVRNTNVKLSWRMQDASENTFPEKYVLLKSNKENGKYNKLFEGSQRFSFIDTNVRESCYYKVAAISRNKQDTLFSFTRMATIIDTTPPLVVKIISATVNKKGEVTVVWNKNKENDLLGYKVFKANRPHDEFVQITSQYIKDTIYKERVSLKTLSKKLYYKLSASDKNHNSSILSAEVEIERPDTIAPSAPVLVTVNPDKDRAIIKYIISSSDDVTTHTLVREQTDSAGYRNLFVLQKTDSSRTYIDSLVTLGARYTYKLQATDKNGNASFSNEIFFLFENGFRKKIEDISYGIDRSAQKIWIHWQYNEQGIEKYILYRGRKNEKLTIIKTLPSGIFQFTDNTVNMGNFYEYRIKAVMTNGAESIISKPINIQY